MRLDYAFRFVRAGLSPADWRRIPETEGVYLVFARGGDRIMALSGYYDEAAPAPWAYGEYDHLYTGKAMNLRTRLKHHLRGDQAASNLRRTLSALEHRFRALSRSGSHLADVDGEPALTRWMEENAIIGLHETAVPDEQEAAILAATASPLNINGRRRDRYARILMELLEAQRLQE